MRVDAQVGASARLWLQVGGKEKAPGASLGLELDRLLMPNDAGEKNVGIDRPRVGYHLAQSVMC